MARQISSETNLSRAAVSSSVQDSEARKFYSSLINVGIEQHASDVHFIPGQNTCYVLFRVDGHYSRILPGFIPNSSKLNNLLLK